MSTYMYNKIDYEMIKKNSDLDAKFINNWNYPPIQRDNRIKLFKLVT